jgi:hypothetical protein
VVSFDIFISGRPKQEPTCWETEKNKMDKDEVKKEQEERLPPHPSFDDFVKYLTFR